MSRLWTVAAVIPLAASFFAGCGSDGETGGDTNTFTSEPDASVFTPPPPVGTGGLAGTGGGASFTGTGGSAGGGPAPPPPGSCNAMFCPDTTMGTPCCMAANGPCGVDVGMGCTTGATGTPDGG
jgi:hypothetical protein